MQYWLLKSEPNSYSIDDLRKDKKTDWTGVRNYQARNFLKEMNIGDLFLFYHSNSSLPGVYGVGKITKEAFADPTAFDNKDSHFDPRSTKSNPIWYAVEASFRNRFKEPVSLYQIKADNELSNMIVAQTGSRLSVMPVEKKHFDLILEKAVL